MIKPWRWVDRSGRPGLLGRGGQWELFDGRGRDRATIWQNAEDRFTWHTWDEHGTGGENAEATSLDDAKRHCVAAIVRQGWAPGGWKVQWHGRRAHPCAQQRGRRRESAERSPRAAVAIDLATEVITARDRLAQHVTRHADYHDRHRDVLLLYLVDMADRLDDDLATIKRTLDVIVKRTTK